MRISTSFAFFFFFFFTISARFIAQQYGASLVEEAVRLFGQEVGAAAILFGSVRLSRFRGHVLASVVSFAACQHGIGQGEFCHRFTGKRFEKDQLVAASAVVHAE